jgi:GDP-4-dehydro-6-deoxy-D-mannose reductase
MRVWVTGYGGFMGAHLVGRLQVKGEEVLATYFRPTTKLQTASAASRVVECDIRNSSLVEDLLATFRPQQIFHLAAQSYPARSWSDPRYTLETNVIGTANIFEGVKKLGLRCRILNACSSAQYGIVRTDEIPVQEMHPLRPLHPYGVSKVAQELLGFQYWENFGVESIAVRIFNTTGPGKEKDVCADFTRRLVEIEKGINPDRVLKVGNLETRRAITDVRDVIRAFEMALDSESLQFGGAYNLSGGTVYQVGEVVNMLREAVVFDFSVEEAPELLRPSDEPIIFGSSEKFRTVTGWTQEIPLVRTLDDMLEYWRLHV